MSAYEKFKINAQSRAISNNLDRYFSFMIVLLKREPREDTR